MDTVKPYAVTGKVKYMTRFITTLVLAIALLPFGMSAQPTRRVQPHAAQHQNGGLDALLSDSITPTEIDRTVAYTWAAAHIFNDPTATFRMNPTITTTAIMGGGSPIVNVTGGGSVQLFRLTPTIPNTNTAVVTSFQCDMTANNGTGGSGIEDVCFTADIRSKEAGSTIGIWSHEGHVGKLSGVGDGFMLGMELGMHKVPALSSAKNYLLHLFSGDHGSITGTTQAGVGINIEGNAGFLWPFKYFDSGINNANTAIPLTGIENDGAFFAPFIGAGTSTAHTAILEGRGTGYPVTKTTRVAATTNAPLVAMEIEAESTGNMIDGFASTLAFSLQDNTATTVAGATIEATRAGADGTINLVIALAVAGSRAEKFRLTSAGRLTTVGVQVPPSAVTEPEDCATAVLGATYYDTSDNTICFCIEDGTDTEWVKLTNPTHTGHCSI